MQKIITTLLFCCSNVLLMAQNFNFEIPKRSSLFTSTFLSMLNDAPNVFSKYKGKLLSEKDSIHLKSKIYQCKVPLPKAKMSRYVADSTFYLEFFFEDFTNQSAADTALEKLTNTIKASLNNQAVVLPFNYGSGNTLRENKIASALSNGIFHYNISVQLNRMLSNGNIRLVLQLFYGRPVFYNWIPENLPISSFNFINAVKKSYQFFDNTANPCSMEIPPFQCEGLGQSHDTTFLHYSKTGYDAYINASTGFDVFFFNLKSGLGKEYVYWELPSSKAYLKAVGFTMAIDIDKSKRKTILLKLVDQEHVEANSTNRFKVVLDFAY